MLNIINLAKLYNKTVLMSNIKDSKIDKNILTIISSLEEQLISI